MIAEALAEQGAEIPADLLPVDVWPVAAPYREAFRVLSASRGRSVGPGGIVHQALEYSEIVEYAERNGFADTMEELEEFVTLVQSQDGAYLTHVAKQQAKK